jgi:hypothetical protein
MAISVAQIARLSEGSPAAAAKAEQAEAQIKAAPL